MTMHFYDPYFPECKDEDGDEKDLCGNQSTKTDYTYNMDKVTCERCLAALRAREGAPTPGSEAAPTNGEAASAPPAMASVDAAYVRLAVLAERERCVKVMVEFFGGSLKSFPLVDELAKRMRQ